MGESKFAGKYLLTVSKLTLHQNPEHDNDIFSLDKLGDLLVEPSQSGKDVHQMVREKFSDQISGDVKIKLRIPMNTADLGQVVRDKDLMEDLNLFDDKDLFI